MLHSFPKYYFRRFFFQRQGLIQFDCPSVRGTSIHFVYPSQLDPIFIKYHDCPSNVGISSLEFRFYSRLKGEMFFAFVIHSRVFSMVMSCSPSHQISIYSFAKENSELCKIVQTHDRCQFIFCLHTLKGIYQFYTLLSISILRCPLLFCNSTSEGPPFSLKPPNPFSRIVIFPSCLLVQLFRSFTLGQHMSALIVSEFVEFPSTGPISRVICRLRSLE